jgi:hypothetical protein
MNRILLTSLAVVALALGASSCQRDPETEPREIINDSLMWDNKDQQGAYAVNYLNNLYTYLPNGFNRVGGSPGDFLACGAGDAVPSRLGRSVELYTNGALTAGNNPDPAYGNAYFGIRAANVYLANIDRVPLSVMANQYGKAETRFIRAMQYFEMLKRFGGVPLVGDKVFTPDDNLKLPRNTFAECVSYIVGECDAISPLLRPDNTLADSDWGRITQGCALALKARVLLYAASPLYNGGQVAGAGDRHGYPSYDASRWQTALAAAQAVMSLNYFSLNPSYAATFTAKRNREIILGDQAANSTLLETYNAPIGYSSPNTSQGLTSPTQEFVDAFPTLTGLPITAAGSGYNAQNPYANRDPRLAASVFVNGTLWLNRPVETFDGGRDRPNGVAVQTRTGYYLRKFMGDFSAAASYGNTSHNYPIFRYAEVLLNYAEALNEVGQTEQAMQQLIALRQRAGLTAGTGSRYGIAAGISQASARTLIRNERRIELGFEDHRFWDIRRWKIGPQVLNGQLTGMQITQSGTAPSFTYTYATQPVSVVSFPDRLYYLPLPYDETNKNPLLTQNPGW